jgi:hypothetical protein
MQSLPFDAVDRVALQLALLNVQLGIYLCCKGMNYAARTMFRRDPPKKSTQRANGPGATRPNGTGQ